MTRLAREVRQRRERLKLSQDELAHQARISRVYLGAVERGEQVASIEIVGRLALALGVSAGELLGGGAEMPTGVPRPEDRLGLQVATLAKKATQEQMDVFGRLAQTYFKAVAGKPGRGRKRTSKG